MRITSATILLATLMATTPHAFAAVYFSNTDTATVTQNSNTRIPSSQTANLSALVKALAPDGWIVNVGPNLEGVNVVWKKTNNWKNGLEIIEANNNGVYIDFDDRSQIVAVASMQSQLKHLLQRNPDVWHVSKLMPLKQNFMEWSKRSNLNIVWKSQWNFPVLTDSTIVGKLGGQNGVIDRVLRSTVSTKSPLKFSKLEGSNTYIISDGGKKK